MSTKAPNKISTDDNALSNCVYFSPLALLVHLETNQSDHNHVFKSFIVESPVPDAIREQDQTEAINIEDLNPITITETTTATQYICQVCHVWLNVTHTNISVVGECGENTLQNLCPGKDYICHHYHSQALGIFQCCGCEYAIATKLQDPVLPLTLFKRLEATRNKTRSYADSMQQNGIANPTLVTTLTTVLIYINDLLNGIKRNINTSNTNFLTRIGLSDGSQALLETIGFVVEENYFIAPEIEIGSTLEARLKRVQQEIILVVDLLRQDLGITVVPCSIAEAGIEVKTANMQYLLGINPNLEDRYPSSNDYLGKAYAAFGLTSGASDNLVAWTYNKLLNEPTNAMDPYGAMDSLMVIGNRTNSITLQTLIACERSKGKIAQTDIGDSYAYFGVTEGAADDGLLIGLYQVKLSDEPLEKNLHQDKLKIIAIARNSSELIDFLKEEKGITSSTNIQSLEDMMGVPAHMIKNVQHSPVGLNNIGNTCYFNSLLQYYFTLIPFRKAMVQNQLYVEDENSESKKIGGIVVDQSEIRRATKFVELLKVLFIKLQETQEKAISPEYELAYMALLNEKDDNTATEVQQEETTVIDITKKTEKDKKSPVLSPINQEDSTSNTTLDKKEENPIDIFIQKDKKEPIDAKMTEMEPKTDQNLLEKGEVTADTDTIEIPASTKTDAEIELEYRRRSFSEEFDFKPNSSPPPYNDIIPDTETNLHFEDAVKEPLQENEPPKLKKRPNVDTMMFGKQQDVTECMSNVMYLVEAALKPLKTNEEGEQIDDMIRQVFYGKARQILSYCDNATSKTVKKEMEEDFSHVIIDASEGKDLYDGLDEYFFADQVENFKGGYEATREVTVKSFPPILQILVQRVQFDRATVNVYKSNSFIQFDRVIYLDRYVDDNFEKLRERRSEVAGWRAELDTTKKLINKYTKSNAAKITIPDLLDITRQILVDSEVDRSAEEQEQFENALIFLEKEAKETRHTIQSGTEKIAELKTKIKGQYHDCTNLAYKLHAVFIHQGQANYGHYWIYILDHDENQWWKYNDSNVSKVNETEIYQDTTGSTANPYFLVYVDADKVNEYVETFVKKEVA